MSRLLVLIVCLSASWPALLAIPTGYPLGIPVPEGRSSRPSGTDAARTTAPITGKASWYPAPASVAAAGPRLRRALGPGWRGTWVRVSTGSRSITVRLLDFCQCYKDQPSEKLIDLSDDDFSVLAPTSIGSIRVRITQLVPPATDR